MTLWLQPLLERIKMRYREFIEQDEYCRANNTPEGKGCKGCPAENEEHCADELRGLFGKLLDNTLPEEVTNKISEQISREFGISAFNQLAATTQGYIEFSEF